MQRNVPIQSTHANFYRRLIPSLVTLFLVCQAYAYTDWKAMSPGGGGWCQGVFPHPTEPKTVWLTTDVSGLFKSTDGGETFENKSGAIHHAEGGSHVVFGHLTQFAIDTKNPNVCYYAYYGVPGIGNLWRSADSGETWGKLPNTSALAGASIIVDRQGTIFCVKRGEADVPGEVWVSNDGGKSFTVRKMPFPCAMSSSLQGIRLAVSQSNRLYASHPAKSAKGLYYTEDQGATWTAAEALAEKTVGDIACSPTKPDLTVAICPDGTIYRADDGKTFAFSGGQTPPAPKTYDGCAHHGVGIGICKSGTILAAVDLSVPTFKSVDDGKTFAKLDSPISQGDWWANTNQRHILTGFAASPCGEALYRTTDTNLMASPDGGDHWAVRCKGIEIRCIRAVVVDVSDPNRVHFAASDGGHFYTTDLGATQKNWFHGEPGFCSGIALGQDPNHPEVFYKLLSFPNGAKGQGMITKSTDRGVTWARTNPKQDLANRHRAFGTLIVDPKDSNHIYVSSCTPRYAYGKAAEEFDPIYSLLESTDAGVNFTPVKNSPKSLRKLILADSGVIYAVQGYWGKGCPAFKYDKASQKWSTLYETGVSDLEVSKQDENIMLLADLDKGELMKSTDGGKTWVAKKDMNGKSIFARSVYIDSIKPNYMLAAALNVKGGHAGILRSTDGGESWHPIAKDYQSANIIGFTYGSVPGRVYLRTLGNSAARMDGLYDDNYTGSASPNE